MIKRFPFRNFKTDPEIIRLTAMLYIRFPLSLRNVEDLLYERRIDISHETVRYWLNRFCPMFAAEIRGKRVEAMYTHRHWQWHLNEVYVEIGGVANELGYVEKTSSVLVLEHLHDIETERRDRAELDCIACAPNITGKYRRGEWLAPKRTAPSITTQDMDLTLAAFKQRGPIESHLATHHSHRQGAARAPGQTHQDDAIL